MTLWYCIFAWHITSDSAVMNIAGLGTSAFAETKSAAIARYASAHKSSSGPIDNPAVLHPTVVAL